MAQLSNRIRRQLFALSTAEDAILLVKLNKAGWAEPYRYCDFGKEHEETEDGDLRYFTISEGERYNASLVAGLMPDDEEDELPSMQIVVDNVGTDASVLIDEDLQDATVDLILVAKSDPDEVLEDALDFEVSEGDCVNKSLTLTVGLDVGDEAEPAVAQRMGRHNCPGMYL